MFERILVPTDGSQLSAQALPVALALGRPAHAKIHLLRSTAGMWLPVLPTETMGGGYYGAYDWLPGPEVMAEIAAEAHAALDALIAPHEKEEVAWQKSVVDADPAEAILDTCHEQDIDLVVMSSHGHSGLERWALGSVTERVLRHAPCPVFVVRHTHPVRHILIPLDGSQLAEAVLPPALEIAHLLHTQQWNTRVTLLRVEQSTVRDEISAIQLEHGEHGMANTPHYGHGERAENYLQTVKGRYGGDGLSIETAVVDGRPAPAILDYAARHDCDLIAMATHGLGGLRRWLYGSVTEKVLRTAQGSLLVVRPHCEDDFLLEDNMYIP